MIDDYTNAIRGAEAYHRGKLSVPEAIKLCASIARAKHLNAGRMMFIGNGGSAAIASHMAEDWTKAAQIPALCFNDGAALTCYGNDLGFNRVFAYPLRIHAHKHDLLFAISSSGMSKDILAACGVAAEYGMGIVTFSGFAKDNALRSLGIVNFYVPSHEYGPVEAAHLILNHMILDEVVSE